MQDDLKLAARVHYSFQPEHYKRDFVDGLCATAHDYSKGEIQDDILWLGIQVKYKRDCTHGYQI